MLSISKDSGWTAPRCKLLSALCSHDWLSATDYDQFWQSMIRSCFVQSSLLTVLRKQAGHLWRNIHIATFAQFYSPHFCLDALVVDVFWSILITRSRTITWCSSRRAGSSPGYCGSVNATRWCCDIAAMLHSAPTARTWCLHGNTILYLTAYCYNYMLNLCWVHLQSPFLNFMNFVLAYCFLFVCTCTHMFGIFAVFFCFAALSKSSFCLISDSVVFCARHRCFSLCCPSPVEQTAKLCCAGWLMS